MDKPEYQYLFSLKSEKGWIYFLFSFATFCSIGIIYLIVLSLQQGIEEKGLLFLFAPCYCVVIWGIYYVYNRACWFSGKYSLSTKGISIKYSLHPMKFLPWSSIIEVDTGTMMAARSHMSIIRCYLDCKYQGKVRKRKLLDSDYYWWHKKNIFVLCYTESRMSEILQYWKSGIFPVEQKNKVH
jgi:hypothetical protein